MAVYGLDSASLEGHISF